MPSDDYTPEEAVRRRENALKRMLATPHQPHAPLKAKKKTSRRKRATAKPKK